MYSDSEGDEGDSEIIPPSGKVSILDSTSKKILPSTNTESNAPQPDISKQQGKFTKSYASTLTQGKAAPEHIEEPEIPAEFAIGDDLVNESEYNEENEEMADKPLKKSGEDNTPIDVLVNGEGTPISADSPMSEFIKSVQFVPLPLSSGQVAGQTNTKSVLISSVNLTAAAPINQAGEFTPRCRESKSDEKKDSESLSIWGNPPDEEHTNETLIIQAAKLAEQKEAEEVSDKAANHMQAEEASNEGEARRASGSFAGDLSTAASSLVKSMESPESSATSTSEVPLDSEGVRTSAAGPSIVSVGKRLFHAIISPPDGPRGSSLGPKPKKK